MRIQVPLVIEMTGEQVREYAAERGLGGTRAKTVVDDVRASILTGVQDLFGDSGTVEIKR